MVDSTNCTFRNNVKSKFSPQVAKETTKSKSPNVSQSPYVSTISPPISAKLAKEVNKISKYFKKQQTVKQDPKSYAEVSAKQTNTTNVTRNILKIKETFPQLQNKKIETVQKIISGQNKPKPRINMTTKEPSHKQIIILMKSDDVNILIKDLSMHVIDINQILKNIKSSTMANYIHTDGKGIIIITNSIIS